MKCEKCGGRAFYNMHRGAYECDDCQLSKKVKTRRPAGNIVISRPATEDQFAGFEVKTSTELPLEELEARLKADGEGSVDETVRVRSCGSCGAQIEFASTISVAECLFCGKKTRDEGSGIKKGGFTKALGEDYCTRVAFRIDHQEAVGIARQQVKKSRTRECNFAERITMDTLRQIYAPFWAFDCVTSTDFEVSISQGDDAPAKTFSNFQRTLFDDWLVSGSHGLPRQILKHLEPFDSHNAVGLSIAPKSDIPLEVTQTGPSSAWARAKIQIRNHLHTKLGKETTKGTISKGSVKFMPPRGKLVQLPLYIFQEKLPYGMARVIVNGETGRVWSEAPFSIPKMAPKVVVGGLFVGLAELFTAGLITPFVIVGAGLWWMMKSEKDDDATPLFTEELA